MTALRDPFDTIHKKDIKNKDGVVVAQVDYVGWSQSADRLDDAVPEGWSFSIMNIGPDWVHGRLDIGDQHFENIGYAENAEANWKKEVLKDAASDAFKRCAALAGVARYLYDKDAPHSPSGNGRAVPSPARPSAAPVDDPYAGLPNEWDDQPNEKPTAQDHDGTCPDHELAWVLRPGGISKTTNKPYDPFWACPSDERPYCRNKPSRAWQARHEG